ARSRSSSKYRPRIFVPAGCRRCKRDRSYAPRGNAAPDAPRPAPEVVTRSVTGCIPTQSVGTIGKWGFTDSAHFSRSFKKQFEVSPKDFRSSRLQAVQA
ncbi:AraC family transcriptional regulator, partial [Pseudomonas carnis]|uniref:AraC family transcriptional regulator n=1 Tax=Pseudomonas TaxID=286 RepID=UPI001E57FAA6